MEAVLFTGIRSMQGLYRIPTLLKRVDSLPQYANRLKWYNTEAVELTLRILPEPAGLARLGR